MTNLRDILAPHVDSGEVPGAVGLVARGDDLEVAAVGWADVERSAPMRRDSIFRIASVSKPILAVAVMILVEEGRIALDDTVDLWLPELSRTRVVRTETSALDDTVPLARPLTLFDLLTFRCCYGFPSDFSLPAIQALFPLQIGALPVTEKTGDAWIDELSRVPGLAQPGERWLYNTGADILSVLLPRVAEQSLPEFLRERIFEQLGMQDTGFEVPESKRSRFTSFYSPREDGTLELTDAPDGKWNILPAFPSLAGGLVSTVDDWLAFGRVLLGAGEADGVRILGSDSVDLITANYLPDDQRAASTLFLEGQGWGFCGQVDVERIDPWNVPGRYGWVGGSGTSAFVNRGTQTVELLFTQRAMTGPTPQTVMRDFWAYVA